MSETRIPIPKYFLLFFGMVAAIVPFAIDAYLPAIPMMADSFGVSVQTMSKTISAFLIGYGFGQFFGGPLSDQIGRKTIGLSGMLLFLIATIGIIFSDSVGNIAWLRVLQALGGGFTSVICMASIRDVYSAEEAGRKYAVVTMIMLLMPLLAPIGGSLLLGFGWQSIFVALFVFVLIAALWYYFGIPETREVENKRVDLKMIFTQFREVIVRRTDRGSLAILYVFAMAFVAGVLLIFVTNSSFIYMTYFKVSPARFPIYFGANVILMIACIRFSVWRMKKANPHRLFVFGNLVQLSACLSLLGYVYFFEPSLNVVFALMVLAIGAMGLVSPNAAAVYISYYDKLSGSATSFNALCLLLVGGIMGAIVGSLSVNSLLPIAIGMAACSLVANMISLTMPHPVKSFKK